MVRTNKRITKRTVLRILFLFPLVILVISIIISKYGLQTTYYTLTDSEISSPICIVQLTDIHGSTFGNNNKSLIERVNSAEPDLIFITGDMVNAKTDDLEKERDKACNLISNLVYIAPVYVSYGNHEMYYDEVTGKSIAEDYIKAGAIILEQEYVDLDVKGTSIRIGGLYGFCMPEVYSIQNNREAESEFMIRFLDTTAYTVLLCHMPICWLSDSLNEWNVDCVFSGHVHGGQIQIPFLGGVWAPDQGWFPGREYGLYETTEEEWKIYREKMVNLLQNEIEKGLTIDIARFEEQQYEKSALILSRGLGNTEVIPRINNIPEIVVTYLKATE